MALNRITVNKVSLKRMTVPGTGTSAAVVNVYANISQIISNTSTFTVPAGVSSIDYMVVGGGGGTHASDTGGGGGGAGGYRAGIGYSVSPGATFTVVIGGGGAGTGAPTTAIINNGSNSGIYNASTSIWSTGGGGGGYGAFPATINGGSGGSGGGSRAGGVSGLCGVFGAGNAGAYTPSEGNGGGQGFGGGPAWADGGGGGGASANGSNSPGGAGGNGGAGTYNTISGANTAYAGGGGGGGDPRNSAPGGQGGVGGGGNGAAAAPIAPAGPYIGNNGTPATGGGGGAASSAGSPIVGGAGGSGVVVIRYSFLQSSSGSVYWNIPAGLIRTYNYGDIIARPVAANIDAYALNGNLVFSLASGSLPAGTSMLANGFIYGTATAVPSDTTSTFTVLATNTLTGFQDQRTFSITVKAPVTANYNYTGADQTLTLPTSVNTFIVHAWGGGGGAYPGAPFVGGGGGYTTAVVSNASNGNSFVIVVGQGGDSRGPNAGVGPYIRYGGGGQITPLGWGGQGGGLSGVFANTGTVFSGVTAQPGAQARAIVIAGGGGGSGDGGQGGEGGGLSGNNAYNSDGSTYGSYGAGQQTDTNNGYDGSPQKGSALTGGNAGGGDNGGGGGGGAGYFGGGGGTGLNGVTNSGGGGSGYVGGSPGNTIALANSKNAFKTTVANTTSIYYANNAGRGGTATVGDNGRVVIVY